MACFRKTALYEPAGLDQTRVHGEIGERIDRTIGNNLLKLDFKKDFLEPFQKRTGASYIGLGKNLEAIVHFAFAKKSQALLRLKHEVINTLLASRDPDGYMGTMPPNQHLVALWDCHEAVHIVTGLIEDWFCFGEEKSLEAARKLLQLVTGNWKQICREHKKQNYPFSIHLTSLGLEYALLRMYKATGEKQYLDFCCAECSLDQLDWPIQLNRFAPLYGHSYMYLQHCRCQLELYDLQPQPDLLRMSRRAMNFMLAEHGMTITGGVGQAECWTDDQDGRGNHAETCSTVYQLRFFAGIFRLTGDARCGDLMERMIFNTLWAAQSPDGRHIRYYSPLEGQRSYYRDTYCCPNNFRRFMAELPGMICFTGKNSLVINLYTASESDLKIGSRRVRIVQQTRYPENGRIVISIEPEKPFQFILRLRIPLWCRQPSVRLNGQELHGLQPGSLFAIKRVWQAGDHVQLDLPLEIRFIQGRQRQYGLAAVMRGPLVYCLAPDKVQPTREMDPVAEKYSPTGLDGAALSKIRLQPSTAQLLPDHSIRILGDFDPINIGVQGDYEFRLTRFPDPEGRCVYFHLGEVHAAVPDELLATEKVRVPTAEMVHGPLPTDV